MKINIVETDEYQIVYVDGVKKLEGDRITWYDLLKALRLPYRVTHYNAEEFDMFLRMSDDLVKDILTATPDNTGESQSAQE